MAEDSPKRKRSKEGEPLNAEFCVQAPQTPGDSSLTDNEREVLVKFAEFGRRLLLVTISGVDEIGKNKCTSPISTINILGLLLMGARSSAKIDMEAEFGFLGKKKEDMQKIFMTLTKVLQDKVAGLHSELCCGLKLLVDERMVINECFVEQTRNCLPTQCISTYDLREEYDQMKLTKDVKKWFCKQSNANLLSTLTAAIESVQVNEHKQFLLMATTHLEDKWQIKPKANNTKQIFHTSSGEVSSDMMTFTGNIYSSELDHMIVVILKLRSLDMVLFAPRGTRYSLDTVLKSVLKEKEFLPGLFRSCKLAPIAVTIPIFSVAKVQTLEDSLIKLGLEELLNSPDLSLAFENQTALPLKNITEATKICVDLDGVSASSGILGRGMSCGEGGGAGHGSSCRKIQLDRPFAYILVSHKLFPLMAGRMDHPCTQ